ncbi:MAG: orotidine-5'-phosphate decarboxylase [Clostridia bacterium]|nr:orotidine-5'-phosphate decarboxylase [Clostridia bacterium]
MVDNLIENIIKTKNPSVIGLDPDVRKIPQCYKANIARPEKLDGICEVIYKFNCDIIDTVYDIVPAVKPQIAFYEKYGSCGFMAFEKTVSYAKSKGLIVIEDAKRNDIGNTAEAYANGHLGKVELLDGSVISAIDADFLTVSPYLGVDSIVPFIDACRNNNKGIFVLVKTSNALSGVIQDVVAENGFTISQNIARYVSEQSEQQKGKYGYSAIGAVVGATYPVEAKTLRKIMPFSFFLVPGYGVQGADAEDILPCFKCDGLGAIVNSSRGVLFAHMTDDERNSCTHEEYLSNVRTACLKMQSNIYSMLRKNHKEMIY